MEVKGGSDYKRLYRSEDDRILAGVCSGIGDYFQIDPVLIRVIWVIGSLAWGGGILIYLLAWILIPKQPLDYS
ncbi:MAG: PspC domain-containing protein [Calditrichaeota bacterium]|jgi:phage shock protein C|nr:PspC domain-containing protein [Calditrichota bacterium]